jgi:hypothetical protein
MKEKLAVQFSGGRTSAFMCWWLLQNKTDEYDMTFCFQNTGQEHENTLKFVDQCDKAFGLNLHWIEADVKEKGVGTSYKIVDYRTASRHGEPFEAMCRKFGLPNSDFPHCTRELKIEPFKKFALDYIGKQYSQALGIRADEPKRLKQTSTDNKKIFPLAYDKPMTKGDILLWWRSQPFDLDISEHLGNCVNCWKKSDRKLYTLAKENPEVFDFTRMIENKYGLSSNYGKLKESDRRFLFRGDRTSDDIFRDSNTTHLTNFKPSLMIQPSLDFEDSAEECGSVWNN